jgi:hypothetical protein
LQARQAEPQRLLAVVYHGVQEIDPPPVSLEITGEKQEPASTIVLRSCLGGDDLIFRQRGCQPPTVGWPVGLPR